MIQLYFLVFWRASIIYVKRVHLRNTPNQSGSRAFVFPWVSSSFPVMTLGLCLCFVATNALMCLLPFRLCCLSFLFQWGWLLDQEDELSWLYQLSRIAQVPPCSPKCGTAVQTSLSRPGVELPECVRLYLLVLLATGAVGLLRLFLRMSFKKKILSMYIFFYLL